MKSTGGRKERREGGVDRAGEGGRREEIVKQRSSSKINFVDSGTKVGSQIYSAQL